jgi:hypothetical protein
MYTITFPEDAKDSLQRLARVLEGLLPEEHIEVKQETGYCHIGITIYEELC